MGKNNNKKLSIIMKMFYQHGCTGIVWFAIGLSELFISSMVIKLILAVLLFISIFLQIRTLFVKTDIMDEMAILHERKAFTKVMEEFMLVVTVIGIYVVWRDSWMIDLTKIYPFIIGILNLLIFIHFLRMEKAGE